MVSRALRTTSDRLLQSRDLTTSLTGPHWGKSNRGAANLPDVPMKLDSEVDAALCKIDNLLNGKPED